jgi:hypothetical protein
MQIEPSVNYKMIGGFFMSRLTKKAPDGAIHVDMTGESHIEKLWRYENTGLEPNQILANFHFLTTEQISAIVKSKMESWSDNKGIALILKSIETDPDAAANSFLENLLLITNAAYHFGFYQGIEHCSNAAFEEWHTKMMMQAVSA